MIKTAKLKPYCKKIGSGVTPRGGDSVYIYSGVALIRSQNVYNGVFVNQGLAFIDNDIAQKMKGVTLEKNDILLNITGDSVARCCMVPQDLLPARVNQHVSIIRTHKERLDPQFLMYYLISPLMQSRMLSFAGSGGTRKALTKEMIEDFDIPLINYPTQQKIASIFSAYDDLIDINRRRIRLLEEAARLLFREWFVYFRFPLRLCSGQAGHEKVKIVDGVPDGWKKENLGKIGYLNYGKSLVEEMREEGDVKVYGSSGVVGVHSKPLVEGPGIIVGRKGNVGAIHWVNDSYWPIDTVYYIKREQSNLFLYLSLKTIGFINTDASVPGLNRDYAHGKTILIPPKDLLGKFLNQVNDIYDMVKSLTVQNQKLAQVRDLLLPRLMNGKIDPIRYDKLSNVAEV